MAVVAETPARTASPEVPLSPGHAASLATTAGITSVITGVLAVGLAGQIPPLAEREGLLAGAAIAAWSVATICLYEARNAVGGAMDATPGDPGGAAALAARALSAYHLGMACLLVGFGLMAAWRVALPLGGLAWLAPLAAAAGALGAGLRAVRWAGAWRRRVQAHP